MENSGNDSEDTKYESKYKTCQVFSVEEKELSSYLKHCSNLNYDLTFHHMAYKYAKHLPGHRIPKTWIERPIAGELLKPNIYPLWCLLISFLLKATNEKKDF